MELDHYDQVSHHSCNNLKELVQIFILYQACSCVAYFIKGYLWFFLTLC